MPQYTCTVCGQPHPGRGRCPRCRPTGRADRSPTTRAQDPEYLAERARALAPGPDGKPPACQLRIRCNGAPATTAEHVIPVARGGKHKGNIIPACAACNYARQHRDAKEHR